MQTTADGLGYQTVLEIDMQNAKDQNAAREAIVKEFG
jgi:multiple sugar transport system substrate-binding protein/putative aldouronate transport system substrate-binding protein